MMKAVFLAFALVLLCGCQPQVKDSSVTQTADGADYKATVSTEQGDYDVQASAKNTESWCAEGSTWSTSGQGGAVDGRIIGIESAGKYAGYCHVEYDFANPAYPSASTHVDIYFNQDNEGYQVMTVNGQTSEFEWTG